MRSMLPSDTIQYNMRNALFEEGEESSCLLHCKMTRQVPAQSGVNA
jgi:hypothetical protein